jgi:hypothetical protein
MFKFVIYNLGSMTTAVIRKKLHSFIDTADDKKVKEFYTIVENEIVEISKNDGFLSKAQKIELIKQASSDPLFLADMKEISEDFSVVDHENI